MASTQRVRVQGAHVIPAVVALIVASAPVVSTVAASAVHADAVCRVKCTIWNRATQPSGQELFNEQQAVELGIEFHSDVSGTIRAVRVYQDPSVAPTDHVAHVWSETGTLLATVTIPAGAAGWQRAALPTRVKVAAGTNYWVSYYAADGLYDATVDWPFPSGASPLHATASAFHHVADSFPDSPSLNNANYWVDVVFRSANVPDGDCDGDSSCGDSG